MFDWIVTTLSSSGWTYLLVAAASAVDALFPGVPADAVVTTGAILAAHGSLSITLVVGPALLGASAGDNVSYFLGAKLGSRAVRRLFHGEKARRRLEWAREQIALGFLEAFGELHRRGSTSAASR